MNPIIKFFSGRLSKEVALQLSQSSGIQATSISFDAPSKVDLKRCQIIICPTLGDNEIPREVDLWLQNLKECYCYALIILADEDENWRHKCIEFELIKRLDQLGGRMIYEPLIIDSSQYTDYRSALGKWWIHINRLSSCDLSELQNLDHSMRISSKTDGYYHIDFRTQEYYQRATTTNLQLICKIIRSLLEQKIRMNSFVFKYIGLYHQMLPTELIDDVIYLNIASSKYLDLSLLGQFQLRGLNLTANSLSSLISIPSSVQSLSHLHLCKNRLDHINGIEQYQQLTWLSVYRNSISQIDAIGDCVNLKYLNIGANPFQSIPKSFSSLRNLETLQLRNSIITEIPSDVLELPSLKRIVLRKCKNITESYVSYLKENTDLEFIHDFIM